MHSKGCERLPPAEMPLVSMRQLLLLDGAAAGGYGVGAFNVSNMEQLQAVTEAADRTRSLVIVAVSRAVGVTVEGELGTIGGIEDGQGCRPSGRATKRVRAAYVPRRSPRRDERDLRRANDAVRPGLSTCSRSRTGGAIGSAA